MTIEDQLQATGLNNSEITVYLYLLENGYSTPPQIAKGTGIARTNTYHLLQSLKEQGLIEAQQHHKRKAYIATDPEALVRALEAKKEAVRRILPDLRGIYILQKNKPKIKFYDGFEQVKEIYWQSLDSSDKQLYGIASTKQLFALSPGFFDKWRLEARRKGISINDIVSYASGGSSVSVSIKTLQEHYKAQIMPKKYGDIPTDILVWDNNVALVSAQQPVFGTVLTNQLLADSFRVIFDIMWQSFESRK